MSNQIKPLQTFKGLQTGDIIAHVTNPNISYIVVANYGDRVTAVRHVDMTQPNEWIRKAKADYKVTE